ncbi:hypothetical protein MTO96_022193 [Rhipicephalus appendiculatus]
MDKRKESVAPYWLRRPRVSLPPLLPSEASLTLEQDNWSSESSEVRLPDLATNLVTFSIVPDDLEGHANQRGDVEEDPGAPSSTRLILVACLAITTLSAVTVTLNYLDWPFLPEDVENSSVALRRRLVPTVTSKRTAITKDEWRRAAATMLDRGNDTFMSNLNVTTTMDSRTDDTF